MNAEIVPIPEPPAPEGLTEEASRNYLLVARHALREIDHLPFLQRIPVLRKLIDGSEVMRVATRKADLSEAAALDWEDYKLDCQREAGQLLTRMREEGLRAGPGGDQKSNRHDDGLIRPPTLVELGVAEEPKKASTRARRWEAVGALPDDLYVEHKTQGRKVGEITQARAVKLWKQFKAAQAAPAPGDPLPVPTGTFATIVADPPWRYGNTSTRGAAQDHYNTLSIEQLCGAEALPDGSYLTKDVVCPKAAEQAHLYLWATAGHLPEAFHVMDAWGFTYKTYLVWIKPQMGMGNYFRVSTELVLFGVKGGLHTQSKALMNYFSSGRGKHSSKPAVFYDLVAKASPGPYLEMFARCDAANQLTGTCQCSRCLRGWEVWGNQA